MPEELTTGRVYKVWIEIEEYDIESGRGRPVDCLEIPCSGTFVTEARARALAKDLHALANEIGDDEVRHA